MMPEVPMYIFFSYFFLALKIFIERKNSPLCKIPGRENLVEALMKGLETGKDKIQKICDSLRKETLEPAKQEAREIVENAHMQSSEIVAEAKGKAAEMIAAAEKEMEEKQRVFHASLSLACRQGIEQLKQKIEKELFDQELSSLVTQEMADPKVIVNLLNSFMKSCEEKGIEEEFVALIPKGISTRSINELLTSRVLERLKNKTVVASDFGGGLQIQMKGRQITIDITDGVVRDLLAQYIRRDLRDLIFNV